MRLRCNSWELLKNIFDFDKENVPKLIINEFKSRYAVFMTYWAENWSRVLGSHPVG